MIDSFVDQLRTFLEPLGPAPYPLHEPTIHPEISQHVQACIDSGWIFSVGEYVRRFESDLAAFSGADYAVVTSTVRVRSRWPYAYRVSRREMKFLYRA